MVKLMSPDDGIGYQKQLDLHGSGCPSVLLIRLGCNYRFILEFKTVLVCSEIVSEAKTDDHNLCLGISRVLKGYKSPCVMLRRGIE